MATMLERAARAACAAVATKYDIGIGAASVEDNGFEATYIDVGHVDFRDVVRAVLMAVREPDDAFMGALYPDPESIVADRGRAAGKRSRRAGRMQIAHFIDAVLADGEGR